MPRIVVIISVMVFSLLMVSSVFANDKVTICHGAGRAGTTHYVTLTISENAVYGPAGHFNEDGTPQAGHEQDYLGACVTDTPSGNPSDAPSETPSESPSIVPSESPSIEPSITPSESPSVTPSETPTETPSEAPPTVVPEITPPPSDTDPVISSASTAVPVGLIFIGLTAFALAFIVKPKRT